MKAFPDNVLKKVSESMLDKQRRFLDEDRDPEDVTPESCLYLVDLKDIARKNWNDIGNILAFNHESYPDYNPSKRLDERVKWILHLSHSRNALAHPNSAEIPDYDLIEALYDYFVDQEQE